MNAIVNTAPDRLEWRDWPLPEPGPGEVRITGAIASAREANLDTAGLGGARGFRFFGEAAGHFIGDIGERGAELRAAAFLGGGPDHVAIGIHQPNGSAGFLFVLTGVT